MRRHTLPLLLLLTSACSPALATPLAVTASVIQGTSIPLATPSDTLLPAAESSSTAPQNFPTAAATALADDRLPPERWQEWPVVPEDLSPQALAIYRAGLALGNDPRAYSKIGDCEATPSWFMGPFDGNPQDYSLGAYTDLQAALEYFQGSHGRTSLAAGKGFTAASVLSTLWADRSLCQADETPLACELRLHRPAFGLVMLGTNDIYHRETFEANLRTILDLMISAGVVPVLATKADNLEGDQAINAVIARLAYDYDLPLWNFWRAVQPLPSHGLQPDGSHLTWAGPYFDDPLRMQSAWPWRNLTALQTLDSLYRSVRVLP